MKRKALTLVLPAAALTLALSAPLYAADYGAGSRPSSAGAQSSPQAQSSRSGTAGQTAKSVDLSSSYKASDLMDLTVKNNRGEDLGKISEVIVDPSGKVSHVVLSTSGRMGMGGDQYVVPWDRVQLNTADNSAIINVDKNRLSAEFAAFEENQVGTATHAQKQSGSKEKSGADRSMKSPSDSTTRQQR